MLNWLKAQAWMVGTIAASATALTLGVALIGAKHEAAAQKKLAAGYERQINDPSTGFVVRLSTCRANGTRLQGALDDQNKKVKELGRQSALKTAKADAALKSAAGERDKAIARLAVLSKPLVAHDSCARVYEMDARLLESLK